MIQTIDDPEWLGRQWHPLVRERKEQIDDELHTRWERYHRVFTRCNQEYHKQERYCCEQREILRTLEDLAAHERQMYTITHDKDQLMTICKTALANLGMWLREQYFPSTYAHATWHRLLPFFQLPGHIVWGSEEVIVELQRFMMPR